MTPGAFRAFLPAALILWGLAFMAAAKNPSFPGKGHFQKALDALEIDDTKRAIQELRLSLQENQLHAESHFLLASLLGREGEIDQALVGYQRTMVLEPNNAVARYNLGTALLGRGEASSAAQMLEEALLIRPDHVPTYNNLAKAYFLSGMPELAVASYQEALRREPSNAIAKRGLDILAKASGLPLAQLPDDQKPTGVSARLLPTQPGEPLSGPAGGQDKAKDAEEIMAGNDPEAAAMRVILRDLPHVKVERRGGRLVLAGWTTGPAERTQLDRVLAVEKDLLDLTGDDVDDPHRLLEVDAAMFLVLGLDSQNVGHNFLRHVEVNASVFDGAMASFGWLYSAAISYDVDIANATEERVAFLARPHLTTLSGSPATFIAGGDIVFKVAGTTSGDIKSYPFGTSLDVAPTLLRSRAEDGSPRIRVSVTAGRKSILLISWARPVKRNKP